MLRSAPAGRGRQCRDKGRNIHGPTSLSRPLLPGEVGQPGLSAEPALGQIVKAEWRGRDSRSFRDEVLKSNQLDKQGGRRKGLRPQGTACARAQRQEKPGWVPELQIS